MLASHQRSVTTANLANLPLGCRSGDVRVEGRSTRSCITAVGAVAGANLTTIEGRWIPREKHPLQTAWLELQVPQCGYCQSGQIMQAATLLKDYPNATDHHVNAVMAGSLYRCMTYSRIREAKKWRLQECKKEAMELATNTGSVLLSMHAFACELVADSESRED